MFSSWWRSFTQSIKFSLFHYFLIFFKTNDKLRQTLSYWCTYCLPLILSKPYSLHSLTIIKTSYWCLNSEDIGYFDLLEHHCSCCSLFILIDNEGTAVKSEVRIYFLDKFWEDAAFIVIRFVNGVIGSIEESILLARMTMKVQIHEKTITIL